MKNPWLNLSKKPPYILPDDREAIGAHNKKYGHNSEYRIWTDHLPVPYVGDVRRSKIVLLQLNPGMYIPPGFDHSVHEHEFMPGLKAREWGNLLQKRSKYPFDSLDPNFPLNGGFRYWSKVFSHFLKSKDDYARISKLVSCVEYFPYHSKSYKALGARKILESQLYGFSIVQDAIKRKAVIVVMKHFKEWKHRVPELKRKNCILLRSRAAKLSPGNLSNRDFEKISRILE